MAQFARVPAIEWKGGDGSQSGTATWGPVHSQQLALRFEEEKKRSSKERSLCQRCAPEEAACTHTANTTRPEADGSGWVHYTWVDRLHDGHHAHVSGAPLALCLPRTPKGCALSPSTTTDGLLMGSVKWFINYPPSRMKAQAKATLAIVSKGEEFVNLLDISLLWLVVDPIFTYIDAGCLF
jgi:hypothetical protein